MGPRRTEENFQDGILSSQIYVYLLCVTCVIITVLNNLRQDGTNRIGNVVQNSASFMKLCSTQLSSEDSYLGKGIARDDMAAPVPLSQEQVCSVNRNLTWS